MKGEYKMLSFHVLATIIAIILAAIAVVGMYVNQVVTYGFLWKEIENRASGKIPEEDRLWEEIALGGSWLLMIPFSILLVLSDLDRIRSVRMTINALSGTL